MKSIALTGTILSVISFVVGMMPCPAMLRAMFVTATLVPFVVCTVFVILIGVLVMGFIPIALVAWIFAELRMMRHS